MIKCIALICVVLGLSACATVGEQPQGWRKNAVQLKTVDPELRTRLKVVYDVLELNGYDVRPMEGYRSPERQDQLLSSNSGVTKVGAGRSCHNYGLAVDSVVHIDGKPSWDMSNRHVRQGYMLYGRLSEMVGLRWGGSWRGFQDYPHVELMASCAASIRARRSIQSEKATIDPYVALAAYWPKPETIWERNMFAVIQMCPIHQQQEVYAGIQPLVWPSS